MIRATLHTNVLVSGLAGLEVPASTPGAIVWHWLNDTFELIISAGILAELERTLTKPYYCSRRSPAQIEAAVRLIVSQATIVVPTLTISGVTTHAEDDLVLAVAASARVDYPVTGNKPLQRLVAYQGVRVISPRVFLDLLEATGGNDL